MSKRRDKEKLRRSHRAKQKQLKKPLAFVWDEDMQRDQFADAVLSKFENPSQPPDTHDEPAKAAPAAQVLDEIKPKTRRRQRRRRLQSSAAKAVAEIRSEMRGDELERLSALEVAALLGVSRATVYRLIKAGDLPEPEKIGGSSRWSRRALREHLEQGIA